MARVHLFEIEDQAWCPSVVRDGATAYLRQVARLAGQDRSVLPLLRRALDRSGSKVIVDLCSGAAGTLPELVAGLRSEGRAVQATLTDLYPNEDAFARARRQGAGAIDSHPDPVDATRVPDGLHGLRTMFNAFHHFPPEKARAVLSDAVAAREPIAVFEFVGRNLPMIFGICFAWAGVLLVMPTVRPVDPRFLLLTYVLPVLPLVVMWDGFVSCLRVYSVEELQRMVDEVATPEYTFEIGRFPLGPPGLHGTYLIGVPARGHA